jgi:hypothetical protein
MSPEARLGLQVLLLDLAQPYGISQGNRDPEGARNRVTRGVLLNGCAYLRQDAGWQLIPDQPWDPFLIPCDTFHSSSSLLAAFSSRRAARAISATSIISSSNSSTTGTFEIREATQLRAIHFSASGASAAALNPCSANHSRASQHPQSSRGVSSTLLSDGSSQSLAQP